MVLSSGLARILLQGDIQREETSGNICMLLSHDERRATDMPRPFRFGVVTSGTAQSQRAWVALAQRAEELGYATLLMPDRPSIGGLAPLTALAVAAAATTSLRVGSYVFCNDYRHPVVLAKEAAT